MDDASADPLVMPLDLLRRITNNFSKDRVLGEGSYGTVYMGEYPDGKKIAVKLLKGMQGFNDKPFQDELKIMAKLRHQNIVRLVGYCNDIQKVTVMYEGVLFFAYEIHRALCLEFMPNGSLDRLIFDECDGYNWDKCYRIIKGIWQGLEYLHTKLKPYMLHLDLKPANILLDENMVPRITDFGMSRLFSEEQTQSTQTALGTRGYLPREFIDERKISKKFDIYSLGVIMIKMMAGRSGYSNINDKPSLEFISNVHENWTYRLHERSHLRNAYSEQIKICIAIGLICHNDDRSKRPKIQDVIDMLNETETKCTYASNMDDRADPLVMPLDLLQCITNNFSEERILGSSAYGTVYMGEYPDGKKIAVKLLRGTQGFNNKQFEDELKIMTKLQHQNIVRLVGYCNDIQKVPVMHKGELCFATEIHRALCLEYMANGSLDRLISDECDKYDWHKCYQIVKGIWHGLKYLHDELKYFIHHFNLKPANILLDENMFPRIADFGMSRLFSEQTRPTQNALLTRGYSLAEMYIDYYKTSMKFDIFSLGVIMIKMMAGRSGYSNIDMSSQEFINNVHENWTHRLHGGSILRNAYSKQVKICIEIGLSCVQGDQRKRPNIQGVIDMLNETETKCTYASKKDWLIYQIGFLASKNLHK